MFDQIPGGVLAGRFGGKIVFAMGNFFSALFCLLTPICARRGGANAIIVIRILTGLAQVLPPCHNAIHCKNV